MGGSLPIAGVGQCPILRIVNFETSHSYYFWDFQLIGWHYTLGGRPMSAQTRVHVQYQTNWM